MDWELFSAGERRGSIQKAIANMKEISFQLEDAVNNLKLALKQVLRAENLANIQYKTNQANAKQAKLVVGQLVKRYGRGLVPLGQLLESQMKLSEAKNQSIQSQYHQLLARGRLLMLTNELIPPAGK